MDLSVVVWIFEFPLYFPWFICILVSEIIDSWKPIEVPKFSQTPEMNLINDNINYAVTSFADLVRLNSLVPTVAAKCVRLDDKKSPPVLRNYLQNMEFFQVLAGSIEEQLQDASDEGIDEWWSKPRQCPRHSRLWKAILMRETKVCIKNSSLPDDYFRWEHYSRFLGPYPR